jgi:hypothetical protein
VHIIVINFSHGEILRPKATVLGVAEEGPESPVGAGNDEHPTRKGGNLQTGNIDPIFRKYLDEKHGHFSSEEREIIEPVLVRHRNIFFVEGV